MLVAKQDLSVSDFKSGEIEAPIALSKLKEQGRLQKGKRIGLLGIGSGLNCSMAEVVW